MATTLEDLVLRLTVDSADVKKKLSEIEKTNKRTAKNVEAAWKDSSAGIGKTFAAATKAAVAFGVAVGGTTILRGLASAVTSSIDLAEAINNTSTRLGVGVEALQEYRFAAEQSGVSQENFDSLLERFGVGIVKAAEKTGKARDAFDDLGVTLEDVKGNIRPLGDLFDEAIGALKGIEDPIKRLQIVNDLFGSRGLPVLQMVDDFEELRKKARQLGLVIQEDTIQKAVEAQSALEALSRVLSGHLADGLVALYPLLNDAAEAFTRVAVQSQKFLDAFRDPASLSQTRLITQLGVMGAELVELKSVMEEVEELRKVVSDEGSSFASKGYAAARLAVIGPERNNIEREFRDVSDRYLALQAELKAKQADAGAGGGLLDGLGLTDDEGDKIRAKFAETREVIQAEIEGLRRLQEVRGDVLATNEILDTMEAETLARRAGIRDMEGPEATALKNLVAERNNAKRASDEWKDAQKRLNEALNAGLGPTQKLALRLAELHEDVLKHPEDVDRYRAAVERLVAVETQRQQAILNRGDEAVDNMESSIRLMAGLADNFVGNVSRSFADMLVEGELTFEQLGKSFAKDFIAAALQSLITSSIIKLFGGSFGSTSFSGAIAGNATGGFIPANEPRIVGERGPEVFLSGKAGFVVPNNVLAANSTRPASGPERQTIVVPPPKVNFSVINRSDSETEVTESVGSGGAREIELLIVNTVAGNISRGGAIAKANEASMRRRPRGN